MDLSEAKVHFVGIGGIGMSGIAEVLLNMGCRVTGSDLNQNSQVERLRAMGASVAVGHRAENIPDDSDVLVYSSAVSFSNPEVKKAQAFKIPIIQRAEMLAELMGLKRGIAIAGTHGKTTTTSMVAAMMLSNQMDPTIVVGGRLDLIKSTAALGKGEWFVAEADESDGSFLRLAPEMVVVTNIDNDHMEHFKTFEKLEEAFSQFAHSVPFYGRAFLCGDDPSTSQIAKNFTKRFLTYGMGDSNRLRATDVRCAGSHTFYSVQLDGEVLGGVELHVPGQHNVLNSLAAVGIGLELKLSFSQISKGLEHYQGVDRRLQVKGERNGVIVVDDYGHHPTEIKATLEALRQMHPKKRVVVAFQPHRYTRTRDCWEQFLECFHQADIIGILDIYGAGETPLPQFGARDLVDGLKKRGIDAHYLGGVKEAVAQVGHFLKPQDVFLTLGAGDVWKVAHGVVESE